VKAFFIDIDGTLTDVPGGNPYSNCETLWHNSVLGMVAECVAEQKGVSFDEGALRVRKVARRYNWWDYPHFIVGCDLDPAETYRKTMELVDGSYVAYKDGVRMVAELSRRGFMRYIVTNNPVMCGRVKLQRTGLADAAGATGFDRVIGANVARGQKSQPEHWLKVLAQTGHDPCETVAVGDNAREDGEVPLGVDVGYSVIVDRNQTEALVREDRRFFVRSLDTVPELFERKR